MGDDWREEVDDEMEGGPMLEVAEEEDDGMGTSDGEDE